MTDPGIKMVLRHREMKGNVKRVSDPRRRRRRETRIRANFRSQPRVGFRELSQVSGKARVRGSP